MCFSGCHCTYSSLGGIFQICYSRKGLNEEMVRKFSLVNGLRVFDAIHEAIELAI